MPYSVPDGFFEQLENNVLHEVQLQSLPEKGETARHTRRLTVWIRSIAAVAATIALVWLGGTQLHERQQDSINEVEKGETARHTRRLTVWIRSIAAVAATIALVWLGGTQLHERQQDSINEVEQAFAGLSTDDQAYMLSVYQDDLFMND